MQEKLLKSLSKLFASIAKSEARSWSFAFFPSPPLWLQGISRHIIFFSFTKKKFVIVSSGMNSFSLQFLAISNFINLLSGSWRKGHCSVGVRAVTVSSRKLFEVSEKSRSNRRNERQSLRVRHAGSEGCFFAFTGDTGPWLQMHWAGKRCHTMCHL